MLFSVSEYYSQSKSDFCHLGTIQAEITCLFLFPEYVVLSLNRPCLWPICGLLQKQVLRQHLLSMPFVRNIEPENQLWKWDQRKKLGQLSKKAVERGLFIRTVLGKSEMAWPLYLFSQSLDSGHPTGGMNSVEAGLCNRGRPYK